MTSAQFKRLCANVPRPKPDPKPTVPIEQPYHPERLTDHRWQWKRFAKGTLISRLRASGQLDEARLKSHFAKSLSAPQIMGAAHGAL